MELMRLSIYKTKYDKPRDAGEQFYYQMLEYAEGCYLRWINADDELTEHEEDIAVKYQEMIEADEGELIEIEIPPEYEVSPEEFEAFVKIAHKLQRSGLFSIINALTGNTFTNDTRVF
jgi:hypothetical protein